MKEGTPTVLLAAIVLGVMLGACPRGCPRVATPPASAAVEADSGPSAKYVWIEIGGKTVGFGLPDGGKAWSHDGAVPPGFSVSGGCWEAPDDCRTVTCCPGGHCRELMHPCPEAEPIPHAGFGVDGPYEAPRATGPIRVTPEILAKLAASMAPPPPTDAGVVLLKEPTP